MFDSVQAAGEALAELADLRRRRIALECAELVLVAQYADCCSPDESVPALPTTRIARIFGSAGTPEVDEFAHDELGTVLATTTNAAATLIGDVLDLRHRLPRLWRVVVAGAVPAWKARQVAKTTRELSVDAAAEVDDKLAGSITKLPWSRFQTIMEMAVLDADPVGAEHRRAVWSAERFVRTGMSTEHGYKTLVARAAAGDVIWFEAMVARIAQILAVRGDTNPAQVRRSKAIGILAQPAWALELLVEHQSDTSDDPDLTEPRFDCEEPAADADAAQDQFNAPSKSPAAPPPHPVSPPDPFFESARTHRSVRMTGPAERPGPIAWPGPIAQPGSIAQPRPIARPGRIERDEQPGRIDPRAAAPKVVLHVHLTQEAVTTRSGTARIEGVGPVTAEHVRRFLGTRNVKISVQPVLDLAAVRPIDAYEIPRATAEAVRSAIPVEVFPFGTLASRSPKGTADLDHTIPYLAPARGGPPGQTRPGNLGPLSRHHHRAKTLAGWAVRQPEVGTFVWRSPHGHVYTVDPTGSYAHGSGAYARALWRAVLQGRSGDAEPGEQSVAA